MTKSKKTRKVVKKDPLYSLLSDVTLTIGMVTYLPAQEYTVEAYMAKLVKWTRTYTKWQVSLVKK